MPNKGDYTFSIKIDLFFLRITSKSAMQFMIIFREPVLTQPTGEKTRIWEPVNPENLQYLNFDREIRMIQDPFEKDLTFWNTLNLTSLISVAS